MDSVREIALTFCASAVLTSAFGLLTARTLEKSGRYITALILLCSVIGAIAKGDFNFSLPTTASTSAQQQTVLPVCEYQAQYTIADILNSKGVIFENITAKATKSEDGSIIINEIEIEGAPEEGAVLRALAEQGIDCRVILK